MTDPGAPRRPRWLIPTAIGVAVLVLAAAGITTWALLARGSDTPAVTTSAPPLTAQAACLLAVGPLGDVAGQLNALSRANDPAAVDEEVLRAARDSLVTLGQLRPPPTIADAIRAAVPVANDILRAKRFGTGLNLDLAEVRRTSAAVAGFCAPYATD